jgi:hypothetical protein
MIRPSTACLAAALALCACAPRPQSEGAAPKAAPYRGGPLPVADWGAGPIRATTYFEAPRIRDLFPLAEVRDGEVRVAPDETRAVIMVVQDASLVIEIDDGDGDFPHTDDPMIGSVRVLSGPVVGPHGERIGLSWRRAGFDLSECEVGVERDANTVFCARPGEGQVTYQFAVPGWNSEEMPSSSTMRAGAFIKAIVWTPPASASAAS